MKRNATTTPKKSKTSQKKKTKTAKQKKQQEEYSEEETEWTDDLIEETALGSFQKGMAKFIKTHINRLRHVHGHVQKSSPTPIVL